MHVLVLARENIDLAFWEAKEMLHLQDYELHDEFLLTNEPITDAKELAYTKKACMLLARCKKEELNKTISSTNFSSHYHTNYALRVPQKASLEIELSPLVYEQLTKPVTNLKDPVTQFEIYFTKEEAFIVKLLFPIHHDFNPRKSHNRPEQHPTALQPKLARAMVNMLGTKGPIVDPFCGAGGILIEAGLMGHEITGYDIDWKMKNRARINLKHYGIQEFTVELRDATTVKNIPYFATDFPYGKNTHNVDVEKLVKEFFTNFTFNRATIGLPGTFDYHNALKELGVEIEKEFTIYLHKHFTRNILLIRPAN